MRAVWRAATQVEAESFRSYIRYRAHDTVCIAAVLAILGSMGACGVSILGHSGASVPAIIVSGGDLGARSSPQELVALVDHALARAPGHTKVHASEGSAPMRTGRNGETNTMAVPGRFIGPTITGAGPRCLAGALGDAGPSAGALIYVADLSWQGVPSFLYVTRYAPPLVHRAGGQSARGVSTSTTTLPPGRPTRLMLVVSDADCHLESATLFS